jgi:putative sterol carrier protein
MNNSDLGLDIEQASTEEAMEVEKTTNMSSKYAPVAEQWKEARGNDESLIIRDVEKSTVESLRNFFYRTFEKENVIVRSTKQEDESYTVTIRKRVNGEYLQNTDEEGEGEETVDEEPMNEEESPSTPEETEKAIDDEFFDDKNYEEESAEREDPVSMSGGPMG